MTEGIHLARDGDEALALLRHEEEYASHPFPDMIFLDLHLPKKSGLEVQAELKSNPKLTPIPVVVISGSEIQKKFAQRMSFMRVVTFGSQTT